MKSHYWGPWGDQNHIKMAIVFWYTFLITFYSHFSSQKCPKMGAKIDTLDPLGPSRSLQIPHVSPQCPPDPHFAQKCVPKTPPSEPPDPQTPYHPPPRPAERGPAAEALAFRAAAVL